MRIAVFGSFYRGFFVLNELLKGPLKERLQVVGCATDDPASSFVGAHKRVWKYGYSKQEATLVRSLAEEYSVPVFDGRVKDDSFYRIFQTQWKPDLCIMATFGQMIDERLFTYPKMGFFNLHPSDLSDWPSRYAGPNPFSEMLKDGRTDCVITVHHVDGGFDTGDRVLTSEVIPIPAGAEVKDMHKITSPYAAMTARRLISERLGEP